MVAGLDRNQILEIKNEDGKVNIIPSSFDTWTTSYKDILKHIFDTNEFVPVNSLGNEKTTVENKMKNL